MKVYDPRHCELGEGAFWHPERQQFFWFDIMGKRLLTRDPEPREWAFDEYVSACGWVDRDTLLIATQTGLVLFDLVAGKITERVADLEVDNPVTRSNDGRADPWGGFWIGTMGIRLEKEAGAIYRLYQARVTRVYDRITVPNAICFAPDRSCLYYADTWKQRIMRQALDGAGWPTGAPTALIDLRAEKLNPDGAVTDADGHIWNAQWGAHRVARYDAQGQFIEAIPVPATQVSCPAIGGGKLFATTAREHLREPAETEGQTFAIDLPLNAQPEPRVIL